MFKIKKKACRLLISTDAIISPSFFLLTSQSLPRVLLFSFSLHNFSFPLEKQNKKSNLSHALPNLIVAP